MQENNRIALQLEKVDSTEKQTSDLKIMDHRIQIIAEESNEREQ